MNNDNENENEKIQKFSFIIRMMTTPVDYEPPILMWCTCNGLFHVAVHSKDEKQNCHCHLLVAVAESPLSRPRIRLIKLFICIN
jgi:hypothetical protein